MVQQILFFVHLCVCFVLIALVLVQQGKGADISATFGSGGQSGSAQSGHDLLAQLTKYSAVVFFSICIALSSLSNRQMRLEQRLVAPSMSTPAPTIAVPLAPAGIPD
ncbi:MAG: preprotein translocase subunit SecG [Pseudomonadota bacterium]